MNAAKFIQYLISVVGVCLLTVLNVNAQCPTLFDYDGVASDTPYWYSCSGNSYTLNLQSPDNLGPWEVNWGDGSPAQTGAGLAPAEMISHTYSDVVDTFTVTLSTAGCTIVGTLVMEEATSASIQIPVGGLTQACAPKELEFINSSTNVSATTTFTWDFGDGSQPLVFDHTNWGQTVSHLYEKGTVDCETVVTLTAENYCNTIQGGASQATFNPIRIWDLDDAAITPSAVVQCYPDTTFTFTNTTERNCLFQGNIFQRQEYWNFGDYWGEGQDSIIDWTPWPPTYPQTISYPGIGTYEVMLIDSNYCGQDTTYINVEIVAPPVAGFTASADTICAGETVSFTNTSSDNANTFSWHFGTGGWINSGSGNISRTFNNPGSYEVTLAVSIDGAVGSCSDSISVPVVVLPAPEAIIVADNPAACDSLTVNFSDASTGTISTWQWVLPSGETHDTPNPPIQYFDAPGAYTTSLTVASANGCSNTNHLDVFVYETPQIGFLPENVCQGAEATFIDQSTASPGDSIVYWNWNFGDGAVSNDSIATHIFPSTGVYTIALEVGTPHCAAVDSFQIEVEPAPMAAFEPDVNDACGPLNVQFTNQSEGAVSYHWDFGDGTMSTEESPVHNFMNGSTETAIYAVTLTASTTFGCTDVFTDTITVFPGAVAQFSSQSIPGCAPFDATFVNNSQGAESFIWNFGDGSPESTEENPVHTFVNEGLFVQNFQVELIAVSPAGCNDTAYTTITAYPQPNFDFSIANDTGCSPLVVQFPNILGAIQLEWNFGDGTIGNGQAPVHSFVNNTNQPVTYTTQLIGMSAFGCVDTAYADFYVSPGPLAQMQVSHTTGCAPLTVSFQNLSLNADEITWTYGDGTSSQTDATQHIHVFDNNTSAPIEYVVTLTAETEDGCIRSTEETITVYPRVTADFDIPLEACAQSTVAFENHSINATSYEWYFGDGYVDLSASPEHSYSGTGSEAVSYDVTLIAQSGFGCYDTLIQQLTIHPQPVADFSVNTLSGCGPLEVDIINNSQNATDFLWNYGYNVTSDTAAVEHTYTFSNPTSNVVNFMLNLEASNAFGCTDSEQVQISVFPDVVADFDITPEGCTPFSPAISNHSQGAVTYLWDFGNGQMSNGENPVVVLENDTTVDQVFEVKLIVENQYGCSDTLVRSILVHPAPQIAFEATEISTCSPFEAVFTNFSEGAESFQWSFGDGAVSSSSDATVTHIYENNTDQTKLITVTLTGVNEFGCTDSASLTIEVQPNVIAVFSGNDISCSPLQTNLINESEGMATSSWFINGQWFSDQNEPDLELINDSTIDLHYEIMLVAENFLGCTDTTTATYTVLASPEAMFIATPDQQTFPDATVELTNLSIADNANYTWNFGDGQISTAEHPEEVTYSNWGTFTITLDVDNGECSDSFSQEVIIDVPLPVAAFSGEASGCQPVTVQFTNQSAFGAQYLWDFGDGGFSATEHPVHTFYEPGTYTVTLTVVGHGGDTDVLIKEEIVEVYPQAVAFFTAHPHQVTVPGQPVNFLNLSDNADNYHWNFGDGNTSDEENPQHFYQEIGTYSISLIADNEYHCPDTFALADAIRAEGGGEIIFPNAFTPSSNGSSGGYFDPTANNYNNDIFFPLQYGVDEYQLLIFNRWGELIFESTEVNRGWDGYYKGSLCKQDVYVWKVNATLSDGRKIQRSGDVTLIR